MTSKHPLINPEMYQGIVGRSFRRFLPTEIYFRPTIRDNRWGFLMRPRLLLPIGEGVKPTAHEKRQVAHLLWLKQCFCDVIVKCNAISTSVHMAVHLLRMIRKRYRALVSICSPGPYIEQLFQLVSRQLF